jgi:hypothetical protein
MFEDLAIMYAAPFLISTGSSMSLLPGVAAHVAAGTFVSPRLFDEEALAANSRAPGRRVGCAQCSSWMLQRDHALCQCEVADYERTKQVTSLLRAPPAVAALESPASAEPSAALCAHCTAIHCERFRNPSSCYIAPPTGAGRGRSRAVTSAGCAEASAEPLSFKECEAAGRLAGHGRHWLGRSSSKGEAPGCLLWDSGNVEYNTYLPPPEGQQCNIRGTCLCKPRAQPVPPGTPAEVQVIGFGTNK